MEYYAALYVKCPSDNVRRRLHFYLDEETRPDFVDEVPESEAQLCEAFEFIQTPNSLEENDEHTLIAHFEPDSYDDMAELSAAVALFEPEQLLLFFSDDEETQSYYQYKNDELVFLYNETPFDDPDRDKQYNRQLPDEVRRQLDDMEDKGKALGYLVSQLTKPG